ncbi:MAG: hypothetical protein ABIA02_01390 [Candidatus Falkowbacteria bacterium]
MRYLEFKEQLKDFVVFTPLDIKKTEADFDTRRLNEWQDKGYIKKIRRGFYIFSDLELTERMFFVISNKIYGPSYISFETALSYYNLIPEGVYSITSATSKKTYGFSTTVAEFVYRKIKPELMFGYNLVSFKNYNFKIAEIEKVLLDYLYINPNLKTKEDFKGLRFNVDEFKEKSDQKKIIRYLKIFNNKSLTKRVKILLNYVNA